MEKRLHRNEHDKIVAGVASGLAEYLQIDITIVRLLFVLSTVFLAGTGLLVYVVMWIVTPLNNDPIARMKKFNEQMQKHNAAFNGPFNTPDDGTSTKWNTPNTGFNSLNNDGQFDPQPKTSDTGRTIGGLILIVLGSYFLLKQLDLLPQWINIFKIYKLWPLALVAIGISLIFRSRRKSEWEDFKKTTDKAQQDKQQPVEQTIANDDEFSSPKI